MPDTQVVEAGDEGRTEGLREPLPEGWHKMRDPATGEFFFVNHALKQRSWVDPRLAETTEEVPSEAPKHGVVPSENAVMAGHVPVTFERAEVHAQQGAATALKMNLSDTSLLHGEPAHARSMIPEPSHLLDHPPHQVFSMNGAPNASGNQAAAFRAAFQGAIGAPLNSLDFSVQRNPSGTAHSKGSVTVMGGAVMPGQVDGGHVMHPIYLTTERVTYTSAPRGNLDNSYDSRDGKYHTRRSVSPLLSHAGVPPTGRDTILSHKDMYVSNRSLSRDMYASNRSVNAGNDLSYTEQLASTMDPVSNMLHSVDHPVKLLPQHRQYVTGDHASFERFQSYVQESMAQSDMREREIERLKQLTTTQAREMAQQREVMGQLQNAHDRSLQQHSELCGRFQALMTDNELLLRQVREGQTQTYPFQGQQYSAIRSSIGVPFDNALMPSIPDPDPTFYLGRDISAQMPPLPPASIMSGACKIHARIFA